MKRAPLDDVRWVRPDGIHLTLKFLGDTPTEGLDAIALAMARAAARIQPFAVQVQGTGAFPSLRAPRVVWLGLSEQAELLGELQAGLEAALEREGFPKEQRGFSPHLTLGRINGRLSPLQLEALAEGLRQIDAFAFPAIPVEAISLIESQLDRSGARYFPRRLAKLGEEVA